MSRRIEEINQPWGSQQSNSLRCHMMQFIGRFIREEEGTTAVEYGLMLALISAALIAAVQLLGTNLMTRFNSVAATILAS